MYDHQKIQEIASRIAKQLIYEDLGVIDGIDNEIILDMVIQELTRELARKENYKEYTLHAFFHAINKGWKYFHFPPWMVDEEPEWRNKRFSHQVKQELSSKFKGGLRTMTIERLSFIKTPQRLIIKRRERIIVSGLVFRLRGNLHSTGRKVLGTFSLLCSFYLCEFPRGSIKGDLYDLYIGITHDGHKFGEVYVELSLQIENREELTHIIKAVRKDSQKKRIRIDALSLENPLSGSFENRRK